MASDCMEVVTISAHELYYLRRDRDILNWMERDYRRKRGKGKTLRALVGGLLDTRRSMDEILGDHVKRTEAAREAARPAQEEKRRSSVA